MPATCTCSAPCSGILRVHGAAVCVACFAKAMRTPDKPEKDGRDSAFNLDAAKDRPRGADRAANETQVKWAGICWRDGQDRRTGLPLAGKERKEWQNCHKEK